MPLEKRLIHGDVFNGNQMLAPFRLQNPVDKKKKENGEEEASKSDQ